MDDLLKTELNELFLPWIEAVERQHTAVNSFMKAANDEIDKLWEDRAAQRDELHAVSNRLENLTRAFTIDAAEVAQKIVNDHASVTPIRPYDQDKDVS